MTRVIGLTGGIASGKSTVARILARRGAWVIDADALAREVLSPGTAALAEVVKAFGAEVLTPDGALDRARLGERVFTDASARRRLEEITHPRIACCFWERTQRARDAGAPLVVYEAALLVESGAAAGLDALVVVSVEPAVQRRRVHARDGLAEAAAQARMDAQASEAERLAVADFVIHNSGPPEALEAQVAALWEALVGRHIAGETGRGSSDPEEPRPKERKGNDQP